MLHATEWVRITVASRPPHSRLTAVSQCPTMHDDASIFLDEPSGGAPACTLTHEFPDDVPPMATDSIVEAEPTDCVAQSDCVADTVGDTHAMELADAAAAHCPAQPSRRFLTPRIFLPSLGLSVLIHGGIVAACIAFAVAVHIGPRNNVMTDPVETDLVTSDKGGLPADIARPAMPENVAPAVEEPQNPFAKATPPEIADATPPDLTEPEFSIPELKNPPVDELLTPMEMARSAIAPRFHRRAPFPGSVAPATSPVASTPAVSSPKLPVMAATVGAHHAITAPRALGSPAEAGASEMDLTEMACPSPITPANPSAVASRGGWSWIWKCFAMEPSAASP